VVPLARADPRGDKETHYGSAPGPVSLVPLNKFSMKFFFLALCAAGRPPAERNGKGRRRGAGRKGERACARVKKKKSRRIRYPDLPRPRSCRTLDRSTWTRGEGSKISGTGGKTGRARCNRGARAARREGRGREKKRAQRAMWRVEGKLQDFFSPGSPLFFFCYGKREEGGGGTTPSCGAQR